MFGLFKKKASIVVAAVSGELIPIDQVEDEVFSQKMMGEGYAIQPTTKKVYAPVKGKISTIFPTKHAIGITTQEGLEVLVHLGIDTVEMNGMPFDITVKLNEQVNPDTLLGVMDNQQIIESGRKDTVVVVYTNMDKLKHFPTITSQTVEHGTEIGSLSYK
ncbi:PTS glucose transporter subunit IIA [Loigolactobacillus coryniformis]|uniref:PTS sugar transporter subunit IIA n=1 Tax=Loigolactobacillus coryniformis TaxID=1610 RepID=UPI00233F80AB|nr:PTS glucose transporter subunit IIA [Loigolactobacillus coryniformis]MDC4186475.1 PTS glucose transporter subunit IIA [Loigolactobacillus coryniformis]